MEGAERNATPLAGDSVLVGYDLADDDEVRLALRHIASTVTIVTTGYGDEIQGMTVTAVCSVSLHPPLLLICLATASHTAALITRSDNFAINVLPSTCRDLATRFAWDRSHGIDRFRGAAFHRAETGAPVLDACLASFDCRVVAVHSGGDHSIFLGRVVACNRVASGGPLMYHQGTFFSKPECNDASQSLDDFAMAVRSSMASGEYMPHQRGGER